MTWLLIFAAFVALDFIWARYTIAMAQGRALASANWAFLITFISAASAVLYVADPWLVVPAACGGWLGTLVGVRSKKGTM